MALRFLLGSARLHVAFGVFDFGSERSIPEGPKVTESTRDRDALSGSFECFFWCLPFPGIQGHTGSGFLADVCSAFNPSQKIGAFIGNLIELAARP